ncbi:hypothetical protein [Sodalis sp. RH16]|uniref:hypothetical protein n=1 Tax=Sodalis sp. RH16 TaxID=3394331 RepID=UPI0039B4144F
MATNDFKPFATGAGANVIDQADYQALAELSSGFTAGKASSAQVNKVLRQATVFSSVLAQFISNQLSADVLDNGDTATLLNNLIAALNSKGAASFLQKTNNLSEIKDAGSAAQSTALVNIGAMGRLLNVRTFTSSGTYTPTPGTTSVIVEVQGGGGAGGGASVTTAGATSVGSGGSGGSYGKSRYTGGFSGVAVVIGAAGVPVIGSNGGNGGLTSFGSLLSAPGGIGGIKTGPAIPPISPQGTATPSLPTGANILSQQGGQGRPSTVISTLVLLPGEGGQSGMGAGAGINAVGHNGQTAVSPGTGGSGAANTENTASAFSGGSGAPGMVIIWEYA